MSAGHPVPRSTARAASRGVSDRDTHRDTAAAARADAVASAAARPEIATAWFAIDAHTLALPLASVAELREAERRAAGSAAPHALMARAGAAVAHFLLHAPRRDAVDGADSPDTAVASPALVWFFAGPGNNGGDALVAATQLHRLGVPVRVTLTVAPKAGDALWALDEARREQVPIQQDGPDAAQCRTLQHSGWCVDGLFGIGLHRPLEAPFLQWLDVIDGLYRRGASVLALDVPSGLDAMTGQALKPGAADVDHPHDAHDASNGLASGAVHASHTMSFIGATPGLFTGRGRDHTGKLFLAPLSLPDFTPRGNAAEAPDISALADVPAAPHAPDHVDEPPCAPLCPLCLNAPALFMPRFTTRRPSSHKGTFGSVAIIGGDTGTCGAAILSARAALYSGAGRVHTAMLGDGAPPYDPPHPEIMLRKIDAIALGTMDALSIGPGLGTSTRAAGIVEKILHEIVGERCHALLDADALNLVSRAPALVKAVHAAGRFLVMTPHPGEAARLLDVDTKEIERDRLAAARALVSRFACTIVLKGAGTLIAAPASHRADANQCETAIDIVVNTTGNTGLATGGTGDVLSGVIGAFLAQHLPPREAALAGVYLHGLAAEALGQRGEGPAGLTAGELAPMIRRLLNANLRQFGMIAG